MQEKNYVDK